MTNIYFLKPFKDKMLMPPAIWLREHGIGANLVTTAGLAAGLGAAICVLLSQICGAVILLGISVGADLLDGVVARLERTDKLSGKLYDAICDRVVELGWIGALIGTGKLGWWALALGFGSVLLLGCRLWAYRCRLDSSAVPVTRFERVTAILAIMLLPSRVAAVGIYGLVTAGTYFSSFLILRMLLNSGLRIERHPRRHTALPLKD